MMYVALTKFIINQYLSLQIEPSVMYDLLISAYRLFRMFVGPFQDISPDEIYTTCDNFFGPVSHFLYTCYTQQFIITIYLLILFA